MKFVQRDLGKSAENSSGGGRRGLIKEIVVLASLTTVAIFTLFILAGWITDFAVTRISVEKEKAFFEEIIGESFDHPVPAELEERWAQAEMILDKLVQSSTVLDLNYKLAYDPQSVLNAYAVPGGVIVLTHGLLEALDEEIAVAFVIAHELGHFAGRDHLRRLGRQVGFGAAFSLLTGGSPDRLIASASELMTLNYNREQESTADRFAIECLDEVYGDLEGAEKLFELLDSSDNTPDWAYMFLTHPANEDRIREILER